MNEARNEAIIERAVMGWHETDIAADMRLSLGTVHGVLSRWRAGPRRAAQKVRDRDVRPVPVTFKPIGGVACLAL